MPSSDLDRLRKEYADREQRFARNAKYGPGDLAHIFAIRQRSCDLAKLLRREGLTSLRHLDILEVGCGNGGVLQELLDLGASSERLHGTELLLDRVERAHALLPELSITCSDGQRLPYKSDSFDIALQFTVFSSILDASVQQRVASEMLRVLKPNGLIIWYDFWLNPLNRQTQGVGAKRIKQLFPGCRYLFYRVTLAPPVARLLAPYSPSVCSALEKLRILNSHFLVAIRKTNTVSV